MSPIRILIVEDEVPISRLLETSLTQAGYQCTCAFDGAGCADLLETQRFDLVLLDVMLPGADGFELLPYAREYGAPVIFITARSDVKDRVRGLKLGAEDYITKPFSIEELLARVEVVLRRGHKLASRLVSGDITVDTEARTVLRAGRPVELTAKEFDLLVLFLKNQGIALYRQTLYERVWQDPFEGDTRTVDLHVQRLRRKLGLEGRLVAVYKVGYRLLKEEET
ncbi:MAG: response regulator transcription factor [Bacteroidales bacterium]|nr:response regulator transcription factor [Fournierella massiliensis]MCF2558278.1 response regulator transcription factor [Fournierella massiliensis]MCI6740302.1 response regulator transcription factor [Bacteroidales bacterium]